MELLALNKDFLQLTYMPYINLQWKRRFFNVGTWSLQMLAKDFDKNTKYVWSPERPEVGIIERIEYSKEVRGEFIQVSGRFLESVLWRTFAYPHVEGNYSLWELAKNVIEDIPPGTTNVRGSWWYRLEEFGNRIKVSPNASTTIRKDVVWQNRPIGECLEETLKTLDMGQRFIFHPLTKNFTWEHWQGADHSKSVLFTDESTFVTSFTYEYDESGYKNHAVVFYGRNSIGNPYRFDQYTYESGTMGKRCILMNVDDTLTPQERSQKAIEELANYPIVKSAKIAVLQKEGGLFYLKDYNLGDRVGIACHGMQEYFTAFITGIDEVFKRGRHEVKLTIGESTSSAYSRVAKYARSTMWAKSTPIITPPTSL